MVASVDAYRYKNKKKAAVITKTVNYHKTLEKLSKRGLMIDTYAIGSRPKKQYP